MGSLRKKPYTKPLPANAELFPKQGKQWARWNDRQGKEQTAPTTTGSDGSVRITLKTTTWYAKPKGSSKEVSTGCRDKGAAQAVLSRMEREAERERAGIISSKEFVAIENAEKPLGVHLDSFDAARRAEGLSPRHVLDTRNLIEKLFRECGFRTLSSVQRHKVEEWMAERAEAGTGARRRNIYLEAVRTFLRWSVSCNRLLSDPLAGIARADQNADVRKERRAFTEA